MSRCADVWRVPMLRRADDSPTIFSGHPLDFPRSILCLILVKKEEGTLNVVLYDCRHVLSTILFMFTDRTPIWVRPLVFWMNPHIERGSRQL